MASQDDRDSLLVSKVQEKVKHKGRDEVFFILQYFDKDIDSAVDAFLNGNASEILKKNYTGNVNKSNNRNKRKKKKNKKVVPDAKSVDEANNNPVVIPPEDDEEEDSVSELGAVRVQPKDTEHTRTTTADNKQHSSLHRDSGNTLVETQSKISPVREPLLPTPTGECTTPTASELMPPPPAPPVAAPQLETSPVVNPDEENKESKSIPRNRHRSTGSFSQSRTASISEESSSRPESQLAGLLNSVPAGPGKKNLERSLKDLSRQTTSLQRVNNLLEEELDNSFKRIKSAIAEAQKLLDERHSSLEEEMERVKKEARQLLNQRKETAAELKQRTELAATMSEAELQELRADIKQFVVDRKYDEELGKTTRFMWDKDRITEEIQKFGEIAPVKNCYSQRRQSVSSVGSSTCQASWGATESNSVADLLETATAVATTLVVNEQPCDSKPSHLPPSYPGGGRSRIFFNRGSNNDYSGGGRGGGPPGHHYDPSNGPSRGQGQPRPYIHRGRGYQSDFRGRGGPRHSYPQQNNYSNKPYNQRYEGPPKPRGQRNPRYHGQHYPRHHDNYTTQPRDNNSTQQQQQNGEKQPDNLVNGFVHTET